MQRPRHNGKLTERGRFFKNNAPGIYRARAMLEHELHRLGCGEIQSSLLQMATLNICAAFAGIPDTPPSVKLRNIQANLDGDIND